MSLSNKFFDDLVLEYEREFESFATGLKRLLAKYIQGGPYTHAEVATFFDGSGFEKLANNFVTKYDGVIKYVKELSGASGIPLVLPERSLSILALLKDNQIGNILDASNSIKKGVVDAAFRYGIGESKLSTIIAELGKGIDAAGRRIVAEAVTGASIYDRTIKYQQFTSSDIKLYFYEGPYDDKTRDACIATIRDPRQSTGWTMADIQSSETPFMTCGGYNCRHEWLPFVDGLQSAIKDMQKDAGINTEIPD